MSRDLLTMVEVLAHEKNVDQSVVLAALESALASAVKKAEFPGEDADIVVKVDPTTGDQKVWRQWLVVPDEQGLTHCVFWATGADFFLLCICHMGNPPSDFYVLSESFCT